jgi:hypothetical protein
LAPRATRGPRFEYKRRAVGSVSSHLSLSPRSPSQGSFRPETTAAPDAPATLPPVFRRQMTMTLRLPPLPLTLLVLLLSYGSAVNANFDIYSGWGLTVAWEKFEEPHTSDAWWIFDGEPDCNMDWRVTPFVDRDDVSGTKLGIRCEGDCFRNPRNAKRRSVDARKVCCPESTRRSSSTLSMAPITGHIEARVATPWCVSPLHPLNRCIQQVHPTGS